jgi:ABC-type anion transport system duplicated permease subunit
VTRIAQPIVQVLASFPANFIFPLATVLFVAWHIPLNFGAGGAWNASIVSEIVSYGPIT